MLSSSSYCGQGCKKRKWQTQKTHKTWIFEKNSKNVQKTLKNVSINCWADSCENVSAEYCCCIVGIRYSYIFLTVRKKWPCLRLRKQCLMLERVEKTNNLGWSSNTEYIIHRWSKSILTSRLASVITHYTAAA